MLVVVYLVAIVAANLSVAYFGPIVTPINAFLLIGLDLSLRDKLHDQWTGRQLWPRMFALVLTGSALAFFINPAARQIAIASAVAFGAAGLVDAVIYQALGGRSRLTRMNGSNTISAAVDSLVFPTLAFGAFMPAIVIAQWIAKVGGGAVWAWVLTRRA